jgi:chromosomal replication initiation ATPase DnaA
MQTYVITGEVALLFRQWLIDTGKLKSTCVVDQLSKIPTAFGELTVKMVFEVVARYYHHSDAYVLLEKTNAWHIARPRQLACYLAVKYAPRATASGVARWAGVHHTTIRHGLRTTRQRVKTDPEFAVEVAEIESLLCPINGKKPVESARLERERKQVSE